MSHSKLTRRGLLLAAPYIAASTAKADWAEVDLALALAADVSYSVDDVRFSLQDQGYNSAFRHPAIMGAVESMPNGLGVMAYHWADQSKVLVPWTRLRSAEDCRFFAGLFREERPTGDTVGTGTSIARSIDFAVGQFRLCPFESKRKVLDISADGIDNTDLDMYRAYRTLEDAVRNRGGISIRENAFLSLERSRHRALGEGVVINALPVRTLADTPLIEEQNQKLIEHMERRVIGGPGSFVEPADGFADIGRALRRKLLREFV